MAAARAALVVLVLALVGGCGGLDNGLGLTPPMGFNTWNYFGCNVTERVVMDAAQALVALGLKNIGYTVVALDDCWQAPERDADGNLAPNAAAFPSGMLALSRRVHALGLQLGMYSSAGFRTCQGLPASLQHEAQDAARFASWEIDLLKYDNCWTDGTKPEKRYPVMRDALNATGRPIFFSMCEWGVDSPATWAREVGNSWRTTIDIEDTWLSVLFNVELSAPLWKFAGPGGWNDPDMLEVGNGGLTAAEERAHFSLWAALKAPLILGCDLTRASAAVLQTISNPEVVAVNQDALGAPARRVWSSAPGASAPEAYRAVPGAAWAGGALWRQEPLSLAGATAMCALGGSDCAGFVLESADADPDARVAVRLYRGGAPGKANASAPVHAFVKKQTPPAAADWREVWAGPLAEGAVVAVLFNRAAQPWHIVARWEDMQPVGLCPGAKARVRDLWRRQDLGVATHNYTALVQPHDVVMLRITPLLPAPCAVGAAAPAAAPAAAAEVIPDGMWGLAWQEALRRLAPQG